MNPLSYQMSHFVLKMFLSSFLVSFALVSVSCRRLFFTLFLSYDRSLNFRSSLCQFGSRWEFIENGIKSPFYVSPSPSHDRPFFLTHPLKADSLIRTKRSRCVIFLEQQWVRLLIIRWHGANILSPLSALSQSKSDGIRHAKRPETNPAITQGKKISFYAPIFKRFIYKKVSVIFFPWLGVKSKPSDLDLSSVEPPKPNYAYKKETKKRGSN